ncbi:MAG: hypothetical protein A2V62_06295, partial [Nitrospirae bacterium RBG_19FT_COMBO_58_9]
MNNIDTASRHRRTERLVVAGSAVLLASVFGNGLNYLFGVFLARTMGADQFGLYALGLTFFSTLALVVPLGMDAGAVKFISEQQARQDLRGSHRTIVQAAALTVLVSIFAALGLAHFAPMISESLYHKPELKTFLLYFALGIPLSALTGVLLAALQAHQTVRPLIMVRYVWEPVGKFLLACLALWVGWGLAGVLGAIILTLFVSLALTIGFLRSVVPFRLRDPELWKGEGARRLFGYCLPLAVATLFGVISSRADMLILGSWVRTHDIGIYQAAFQTASALALILGALETSLTPFFGQMHAQQDMNGLKHMYQTASKLVVMCTVPLFVLLTVFSQEILSLFGPEFGAGGTLLVILAAGQTLSSAGGSPNNLLLMGGHSRLVMWNTVGVGALSIAVFAMTIPLWGVLGAAIGAASTQVLGVCLRIFQVWRLYHIHPFTQQ